MKTVKFGQFSIRHDTVNGYAQLRIFRSRERSWCAGIGNAHQTKSGYWIVSIMGQQMDVAKDWDEAVTMLREAILAKVNRFLVISDDGKRSPVSRALWELQPANRRELEVNW